MLISNSQQFIFVHIPKVAGSSIRRALRPWAVPEQQRSLKDRLLHRVGILKHRSETTFLERLSLEDHSTAQKIRLVLPHEFDQYFTFAFVRNPWDWHVSYYAYVTSQAVPDNQFHVEVRAAGSFAKYATEVAPRHNFQQKSFVVDEAGQCMVNYIGRYETLESDFHHICEKLSISASLPRLNISSHGLYQEYYDDVSRRAMEPAVRADCEYFRYDF